MSTRHLARLCRLMCPALAAGLLAATLAPPARASDGVLEINRTCALNTGCFPGDARGLPVTIREPGSYVFTSNLDYYGKDTTAVLIQADNVTVDLNGFRVACYQAGIVIGGGDPPFCGQATDGDGSGILVDNLDARHGNEVRNGSVVGTSNFGVRLGWHSAVRNMRVHGVDGTAIQTYHGSVVEGNVVFGSGTGINLQFTGGFRDNVLYGNATNVVGGVNLGGNMCNAGLCP